MFHFNGFPEQLNKPEVNVFQYQTNQDYRVRHSFPQHYSNQFRIFNNFNGQQTNQDNQLNSNEVIPDCAKRYPVVGLIPAHISSSGNISSPDYTAGQSYYNFPRSYQNSRGHVRNSHYTCTTKSEQNSLRASLKRKRKRTVFTTDQIIALEEVFQRKPYINRAEREEMMNTLQVSERAIKVWFQNRRRINVKTENTLDFPATVETPDSFSDRLSSIEAQIRENTDENGYVTLNDNIMSELVSVIDDRLSQNVSLTENQDPVPDLSKNKDIVMYEPISPASSEDLNENTIDNKSEESWNVLEDIQSVLFL